jgi:hypothetical protein
MMRKSGIQAGFGAALALCALTACNSHPVSLSSSAGVVEIQEKTNIAGSEQMDILWVVDNSGSMCQEQRILRDNFSKFIDELNRTNLDFHIGVTTTDMNETYMFEPVASPGKLQATPQPVPGFDKSCWYAPDGAGGIKDGLEGRQLDLSPIRDAITAAVSCMQNPDSNRFNFTDAQLRCALEGTAGCEIPGVCGGGLAACSSASIFPQPNEYRNIPKVLRAADYKTGSLLDVDRLTADFACMSLVGTRGFGIETGLVAAVEAVSPVNTGGPIDPIEGQITDATADNHGLIRRDARFALIFVTDENDCSHDGSRSIPMPGSERPSALEITSCGADVCEFANVAGQEATSPLIPIETLREQFMANLAASKGRDAVGPAEVFVASIHGNFQRYDGQTPDACDGTQTFVFPSCATVNGTAYSGDRYERFLRTFPEEQFFPQLNTAAPELPLTGFMCNANGDFGPALQAIGELISQTSASCVSDSVMPCEGPEDNSCPPVPYTNQPGRCLPLPNTGGPNPAGVDVPISYYCDSGLQVRAKLASPLTPLENLTNSGYCIEGSVGDIGFPRGCVVTETKYTWNACPSGFPGLKLSWNNELEATNALAGTELQIRYNSVTSTDIQ